MTDSRSNNGTTQVTCKRSVYYVDAYALQGSPCPYRGRVTDSTGELQVLTTETYDYKWQAVAGGVEMAKRMG